MIENPDGSFARRGGATYREERAMGVLTRKSDEEKAANEAAKQEKRATDEAATAERQAVEAANREQIAAFQAGLPRHEYQVKRVGEDKQKGLLGSQRMEQIFNAEGDKGWELVMINEERATFKRQLPPRR
jgi:hypothetical protein